MQKIESNEEALLSLLQTVLQNQNLTESERSKLFFSLKKGLLENSGAVPISIFSNQKLGALEAIVKFLRENRGLPFKEIASLTNRKQGALAVTYHAAKKKMPEPLVVIHTPYLFPVILLKESELSVLETLVAHIKSAYGLTNHQIGKLLCRNDKTIWTVQHRAKQKRGGA